MTTYLNLDLTFPTSSFPAFVSQVSTQYTMGYKQHCENQGARKAKEKNLFTNTGITFSHAVHRSYFIVVHKKQKMVKNIWLNCLNKAE